MKLKIIFCCIIVFTCIHAEAQYGTGLKGDTKYKSPLKNNSGLGYAGQLPQSFSIKAFTPYAKNQGNYGTCAAWSSVYDGYTTAYAYARGMTDRTMITTTAFCPYYIYNNSTGSKSCEDGMFIQEALISMYDNGVKKFYMPVIGCGSAISSNMTSDASLFKIKDAGQIYDYNNLMNWSVFNEPDSITHFLKTKPAAPIKAIKEALVNGSPVIYGSFIPMSFFAVTTNSWEPTDDEKINPGKAVLDNTGMHQLHAMIIVSYDENKNGGSFEIMNSWGGSWGENGFAWIKYDDWALFAYQAFYLELNKPSAKELTETGCVFGDCSNGYGIYKQTNGERYEGHFKNGNYNGYGIYNWPTGRAYAGEWADGKRNGEAIVYLADGSYGFTNYVNDNATGGYSDWYYDNGDIFFGPLDGDMKKNGYGIYKYADGSKYEGFFKEDKLSGLGILNFANGNMYMGEFEDGQYNGYGIYVSSLGDIKAGTWSYNELSKGYSTLGYAAIKNSLKLISTVKAAAYATADCVEGDCLNGNGDRAYQDGSTYKGEFKEGVEDGYGTKAFANGTTMKGMWKQGKTEGLIKIHNADGSNYLARFISNAPDGYVLEFSDAGNMIVHQYAKGEYVRSITEQFSTAPGSVLNTPNAFNKTKPHAIAKVKAIK